MQILTRNHDITISVPPLTARKRYHRIDCNSCSSNFSTRPSNLCNSTSTSIHSGNSESQSAVILDIKILTQQ